MNIAVFSIARWRLEVEAANGNAGAQRVLDPRQHSNQVLTTILWGNVAINVLLALLSDSTLSGMVAFVLIWTEPPRLISGDDILRRLLKGVGS